MIKKCPRCGRILPETEFAPRTRHCRLCRRDYDWQYKYGISPEQYYELYKAQNGKCMICGKELENGKYLDVDHDKNTGAIRGLLCNSCNKGLGMFREDTEIMKNAIKYLEVTKCQEQ